MKKVFFCYSHADEHHREKLEKHLSILKNNNQIEGWHDRKIQAGSEWDNMINEHLTNADIILLLLSSDFLASSYCIDIEMKTALEQHEAGKAKVIPIIVRPVDWEDSPLHRLQALPKDGKPITTWDNEDEAWVDVAKGIKKVAIDTPSSAQTMPDERSTIFNTKFSYFPNSIIRLHNTDLVTYAQTAGFPLYVQQTNEIIDTWPDVLFKGSNNITPTGLQHTLKKSIYSNIDITYNMDINNDGSFSFSHIKNWKNLNDTPFYDFEDFLRLSALIFHYSNRWQNHLRHNGIDLRDARFEIEIALPFPCYLHCSVNTISSNLQPPRKISADIIKIARSSHLLNDFNVSTIHSYCLDVTKELISQFSYRDGNQIKFPRLNELEFKNEILFYYNMIEGYKQVYAKR